MNDRTFASLRTLALASPLAFTALPAAAHHGWSSYSDQTLELTGVVDAASYENPHGSMQLRQDGKVWNVILAPPSRMQSRGLAPAMLTPGKEVSVEGHQHKTDGAEMRAERITVDGKTIELR